MIICDGFNFTENFKPQEALTGKKINKEIYMKPSVLITGASGFIGSFIVEEALKRNYDVWAGIRSTSSKKYLSDKRIHFLILDFDNLEELRAQISGHKGTHAKWDYVVHCAGATKCRNKAEFDRSNFLATKYLVEALKEFKMMPAKFVYISTLGAFGPTNEETFKPISENDTPVPNTAYGMSKLKTEQYLNTVSELPYIIIRPTGVYGPRERDYYLMAKSIKNHVDFSVALKRQDITFIYVKDLVEIIFLALESPISRKAYFASDGGVYCSSTFSDLIQKELGNPFVMHFRCPLFILKTVSLLAEFFAGCFGKSSTLNSDKYKIMKQQNWQCDIAPLQSDLNYQPKYSLEEGVRETIAWYKKEGWL